VVAEHFLQNDWYVRVLSEGGNAQSASSEWIPLTHLVTEAFMICDRCGSIMKHEEVLSRYEPFSTWRCLLCGEYLDEVIIENRKRHVGSQIDHSAESDSDGSAEPHSSLDG